jgi:hypothetical protein
MSENLPAVLPDDEGMDQTVVQRITSSLPMCNLGHETSSNYEKGKLNFSFGLVTEEVKNLSLVFVKLGRVLFSPDFNKAPVCASDNSFEPSARIDKPLADTCLMCPYKEWGKDIPEKIKLGETLGIEAINKPFCKETLSGVFVMEDGRPFMMQFNKSQFKFFSDFLDQVRSKFQGKGIYKIKFDMRVGKSKARNGKEFYCTEFVNTELCDLETQTRNYKLLQDVKAVYERVVNDKFEEMDNGKERDDIPF